MTFFQRALAAVILAALGASYAVQRIAAGLTITQRTQAASLIMCLAGMVAYGLWAYRNPRRFGYAVAPFTWLLHGVIFYTFVFLRDFYGLFADWNFTFWSSVLRLQGFAMAAGIGVLMLLEVFIVAHNRKLRGNHAS